MYCLLTGRWRGYILPWSASDRAFHRRRTSPYRRLTTVRSPLSAEHRPYPFRDSTPRCVDWTPEVLPPLRRRNRYRSGRRLSSSSRRLQRPLARKRRRHTPRQSERRCKSGRRSDAELNSSECRLSTKEINGWVVWISCRRLVSLPSMTSYMKETIFETSIAMNVTEGCRLE